MSDIMLQRGTHGVNESTNDGGDSEVDCSSKLIADEETVSILSRSSNTDKNKNSLISENTWMLKVLICIVFAGVISGASLAYFNSVRRSPVIEAGTKTQVSHNVEQKNDATNTHEVPVESSKTDSSTIKKDDQINVTKPDSGKTVNLFKDK